MPPAAGAAGKTLALTKPKLLIGEGLEEVLVFSGLLRHMGLDAVFQVETSGGKTGLTAYLRTLVRVPGFAAVDSVGITRDADFVGAPPGPAPATRAAANAFASVCGALEECRRKDAAFPLSAPAARGGVARGRPNVGVFIPPDCVQDGMLEDVCWGSVAGDPAVSCVAEFAKCVERVGRPPKPHHRPKFLTQVWLATREPDVRLGIAAGKAPPFWNFAAPSFEPLRQFILRL